MDKIETRILKGFADLSAFPVVTNTPEAYEVGERVSLPGAQSLTKTDNVQEYTIPGDDSYITKGADYQGAQLVVTVAGLYLETLAQLTGADFDEDSKEYSDAELDVKPELALTFSGLQEGGGKRLFRYYSCKLASYKADLNTKPSNQTGSAYALTFNCSGRRCDPKHRIRALKDAEPDQDGTLDVTWLNTIPKVPVGG